MRATVAVMVLLVVGCGGEVMPMIPEEGGSPQHQPIQVVANPPCTPPGGGNTDGTWVLTRVSYGLIPGMSCVGNVEGFPGTHVGQRVRPILPPGFPENLEPEFKIVGNGAVDYRLCNRAYWDTGLDSVILGAELVQC